MYYHKHDGRVSLKILEIKNILDNLLLQFFFFIYNFINVFIVIFICIIIGTKYTVAVGVE